MFPPLKESTDEPNAALVSTIRNCYPYPVQHAHDRQSRVNDCLAPSAENYPRFDAMSAWQAVLRPGDLLYIVSHEQFL
jgi:hypothetical protein